MGPLVAGEVLQLACEVRRGLLQVPGDLHALLLLLALDGVTGIHSLPPLPMAVAMLRAVGKQSLAEGRSALLQQGALGRPGAEGAPDPLRHRIGTTGRPAEAGLDLLQGRLQPIQIVHHGLRVRGVQELHHPLCLLEPVLRGVQQAGHTGVHALIEVQRRGKLWVSSQGQERLQGQHFLPDVLDPIAEPRLLSLRARSGNLQRLLHLCQVELPSPPRIPDSGRESFGVASIAGDSPWAAATRTVDVRPSPLGIGRGASHGLVALDVHGRRRRSPIAKARSLTEAGATAIHL
mmetsp:Transcript_25452/g.79311  ORF Transcript_25452/g.79311 Transcript_25452/m.79311 type:complete len:291 (+) Transcript_25452:987-1859(+)